MEELASGPLALPALDPEASLRFRAYLAKAVEEFDKVVALHTQAIDEVRSMKERGAVPEPPSDHKTETSAATLQIDVEVQPEVTESCSRRRKSVLLHASSLESNKTHSASQGFYYVCPDFQEVLTPSDILRLVQGLDGAEGRFQDVDAALDEDEVDVIREAVQAFNEATQRADDDVESGADLSLHGYTTLLQMEEETLRRIITEPTNRRAMARIRSCLQAMDNLQKMRLELEAAESRPEEGTQEEKQEGGFAAFVSRWLDPVVGAVIALNALVIGLSVDNDPGWGGWVAIEASFTSIFLLEIVIKVSLLGFWNHFLGSAWSWNMFDAVIVLLAIFDHLSEFIIWLFFSTGLNLPSVTALRLLRFLRVSKLARVLRLKIFKELNLLVTGFVSGLKTLLFAICFLGFVIYCMGVMVRMYVGTGKLVCEREGECTDRSDMHWVQWRGELFGSVAKAMFTVFRCFTDGCASVDGTPLMPILWNIYGSFAMIFYVFSTLIVTFGLFNLIAAIFVENTIQNSIADDETRRAMLARDHVRTAYRLQQCITKIAADMDQDGNLCASSAHLQPPKPVAGLLGFFATSQPISTALEEVYEARSTGAVSITPMMLHSLLQCKEVQALIEKLDINLHACDLIYDALDSDGNGSLDVCELVQGMLKLRGDVKFDTVETIMTMRSLQKSQRNMEAMAMSQQKAMVRLRRHQVNLEKWILPPGMHAALSVDQQRTLDSTLEEVDLVVKEELELARRLSQHSTSAGGQSAESRLMGL